MKARAFGLSLLLALFAAPAWSGGFEGDNYVGSRYGRIEVRVSPGQWVVLDREAGGGNEYGGPVADFKSTEAVDGYFPAVHLSAFRRADAGITPEFVLQTSLDAVLQKGGVPAPVEQATVNGKNVWFFTADVTQQGRPARLYLVLMAGPETIYSLQTVVPVAALAGVRRQVDALVAASRY